MILLSPESGVHFEDYGIAVPKVGSRAEQILAALRADPDLGQRESEWLHAGRPAALAREDLLRVHSVGYVDELLSDDPARVVAACYELEEKPGRYDPRVAVRPLRDLVSRALANAAGTHTTSLRALDRGFAFFLGGGMHHAMRDAGRGFCLVNDIVISLARLLHEGRIGLAWVVDLDAHRGDGTAELCLQRDDIQSLSIHMARGWPLDGPALDAAGGLPRWRWPNDVDIPAPEGGEAGYLPALEAGLALLEALGFGRRPDLAMVVAGADPFEEDALESAKPLQLSLEQMLARDRLVYRWLRDRRVPQAWLLSGGYGPAAFKPPAAFLTETLRERLGITP